MNITNLIEYNYKVASAAIKAINTDNKEQTLLLSIIKDYSIANSLLLDQLKSDDSVSDFMRELQAYIPVIAVAKQMSERKILDNTELFELWRSGLNYSQIAKRMGLTPNGVKYRLKKAGVKLYGND